MKDIKHIRREFYSAAWVLPQGMGLWGYPGGQTFFFKHGHVAELSLESWKQEFRTPIWQKVGVPLEKLGVLLQKSWSPTNLCIPYIFSILAVSDTFK